MTNGLPFSNVLNGKVAATAHGIMDHWLYRALVPVIFLATLGYVWLDVTGQIEQNRTEAINLREQIGEIKLSIGVLQSNNFTDSDALRMELSITTEIGSVEDRAEARSEVLASQVGLLRERVVILETWLRRTDASVD